MKCKNCGGVLHFNNGVWECDSCRRQFSNFELYNDVEVYIDYIESDKNGRRTKDSVIAQELFHILEDHKVNVFYKRISAEEYSGEEMQQVEEVAMKSAKLVLIVGTTSDSFKKLWEKDKDSLATHKVIPVYHDMEAEEIPKEINSIQALKYDRVGATRDLTNVVLRTLGRQEEIEDDFESLSNKSIKTKKIIIIVLVIVAVLAVGVTTFVIIHNKNTEARQLENKKNMYSDAITHMDNGEYADAIGILSDLGDYNDSKTLLKNCYSKYSGYYLDKNNDMYFEFQYYDNNGSIKIDGKSAEGKRCTINETINFAGVNSEFNYTDSEGNHGNGKIVLTNSSVELNLNNTDLVSGIYIQNTNAQFKLDERQDQPISKDVNADLLKKIVSEKTTINDLKRDGYEISFLKKLSDYNDTRLYKFDNADITLVAAGNKAKEGVRAVVYEDEKGIAQFKYIKVDPIEADVIEAVIAPAKLLAPNLVGQSSNTSSLAYVEGDILVCPDSDVSQGEDGEMGIGPMHYNTAKSNVVINSDTPVCICSKKSVGNEAFQIFMKYMGLIGDNPNRGWEDLLRPFNPTDTP